MSACRNVALSFPLVPSFIFGKLTSHHTINKAFNFNPLCRQVDLRLTCTGILLTRKFNGNEKLQISILYSSTYINNNKSDPL